MKSNHQTNEGGFTLIEILIFIALFVIMAAGFLGLQYIFSQNQVTAWQNYLSIEDANNNIAKMVKEIRDARQSETGTYLLEETQDQQIVFYSDIDHDDVVERVRYTLSGTTLTQGVTEPTGEPLAYDLGNEKEKTLSTIIRNGTNPVFLYYNGDWPADTVNNPLAAENRIADTRMIVINLKTNDKVDQETDFTLESSSKIRTLAN